MHKLNKTDFEKQLKDILKTQGIKFNKRLVELLYQEISENNIKININDGFNAPLFKYNPDINRLTQNVFFLHGCFHIYQDKRSIYKITKTQDKALYERLDEIIGDETMSILSVFTNEDKLAEIEKSKYLKTGQEKLKSIEGAIVIIGSSLDQNDEHNFTAINQSSISDIYFASNEKEKKKHLDRLKILFPNKNIFLYDRDTVTYDKRKLNELGIE